MISVRSYTRDFSSYIQFLDEFVRESEVDFSGHERRWLHLVCPCIFLYAFSITSEPEDNFIYIVKLNSAEISDIHFRRHGLKKVEAES